MTPLDEPSATPDGHDAGAAPSRSWAIPHVATIASLDESPQGAWRIETASWFEPRLPFPVCCGACGQELIYKFAPNRYRYHHPPVRKASPYCPLGVIFTTWPSFVARAAYAQIAALGIDPLIDSLGAIFKRHVVRVDVIRDAEGAQLRDVFTPVLRYA